jgi:hypothetical protein
MQHDCLWRPLTRSSHDNTYAVSQFETDGLAGSVQSEEHPRADACHDARERDDSRGNPHIGVRGDSRKHCEASVFPTCVSRSASQTIWARSTLHTTLTITLRCTLCQSAVTPCSTPGATGPEMQPRACYTIWQIPSTVDGISLLASITATLLSAHNRTFALCQTALRKLSPGRPTTPSKAASV